MQGRLYWFWATPARRRMMHAAVHTEPDSVDNPLLRLQPVHLPRFLCWSGLGVCSQQAGLLLTPAAFDTLKAPASLGLTGGVPGQLQQ